MVVCIYVVLLLNSRSPIDSDVKYNKKDSITQTVRASTADRNLTELTFSIFLCFLINEKRVYGDRQVTVHSRTFRC